MLTPQEQAELNSLMAEAQALSAPRLQPKIQQQTQTQQQVQSSLTPSEEAELAQLLTEAQAPEERGFAQRIGEGIDKYTLSSTLRSGVGALGGLVNPDAAYFSGDPIPQRGLQFMPETGQAATGREIAIQAGIPDKPYVPTAADIPAEAMLTGLFSKKATAEQERMLAQPEPTREELIALQERGAALSPAQMTGFALDAALDPTLVVPIGTTFKAGVKYGVKPIIKGTAEGVNFMTNTRVASEAVKIAGGIGRKTKQLLNNVFSPTVAKDAEKFFDIAKKNNIDLKLLPETVEFGRHTTIGKMARAQAELGGERAAQWMDALEKVDDVLSEKARTIAGPAGILDDIQAGAKIKEGIEAGTKSFFDSMDITYNRVLEMAGGDIPISADAARKMSSRFNKIEESAAAAMRTGTINTSASKDVLGILQKSKEALASGSQAEILRQARDIRTLLQKPASTSFTPDRSAIQRIYQTLTNGFVDSTTENLGKDIGETLARNNKAMAEFIENLKSVEPIVLKNAESPEKIYRNLITSGSSGKIESLRRILLPEDFNAVRASFLDNVIKKNVDGYVLHGSSLKELTSRKSRPLVEAMFTADELAEISDMLKLGDRIGSPILNTSATATSQAFRKVVDTAKNMITSEAILETLKRAARTNSEKAIVEAAKNMNKTELQRFLSTMPAAQPTRYTVLEKGARVRAVQKRSLQTEDQKE